MPNERTFARSIYHQIHTHRVWLLGVSGSCLRQTPTAKYVLKAKENNSPRSSNYDHWAIISHSALAFNDSSEGYVFIRWCLVIIISFTKIAKYTGLFQSISNPFYLLRRNSIIIGHKNFRYIYIRLTRKKNYF